MIELLIIRPPAHIDTALRIEDKEKDAPVNMAPRMRMFPGRPADDHVVIVNDVERLLNKSKKNL